MTKQYVSPVLTKADAEAITSAVLHRLNGVWMCGACKHERGEAEPLHDPSCPVLKLLVGIGSVVEEDSLIP